MFHFWEFFWKRLLFTEHFVHVPKTLAQYCACECRNGRACAAQRSECGRGYEWRLRVCSALAERTCTRRTPSSSWPRRESSSKSTRRRGSRRCTSPSCSWPPAWCCVRASSGCLSTGPSRGVQVSVSKAHTHTHTHTHRHAHARAHTHTHTHTTRARTHTHTPTPTRTPTPTPTRTHTHTDTHRHTQTHTDTHRHTQTHTDTHRHTQTHTDTHRHTQTHTDTHRHTHTHTHTHTHRHTHTHTGPPESNTPPVVFGPQLLFFIFLTNIPFLVVHFYFLCFCSNQTL